MDYQILVLDLDGTLTNSKKEITQPTLEALIEIQEAGKKVVLATRDAARTAAQRTLCFSSPPRSKTGRPSAR